MTDAEIIKALKCCNGWDGRCLNCPLNREGTNCKEKLTSNALDLINCQKAQIEKLKQENEFCHKTITDNAQRALEVTVEEIETAKSEAIKEFAEILKENYCFTDSWGKIIPISTVDDIVKEMTEVQK